MRKAAETNINVKLFIDMIDEGPFCGIQLNKKGIKSQDVADANKDIGDIFDCAVYQAFMLWDRNVSAEYDEAHRAVADAFRKYLAKPLVDIDDYDEFTTDVVNLMWACLPNSADKYKCLPVIEAVYDYLCCCEDLRNKYPKHFSYSSGNLDAESIVDKIVFNWSELVRRVKSYAPLSDEAVEFDSDEFRKLMNKTWIVFKELINFESPVYQLSFSLVELYATVKEYVSIVKFLGDEIKEYYVSALIASMILELVSDRELFVKRLDQPILQEIHMYEKDDKIVSDRILYDLLSGVLIIEKGYSLEDANNLRYVDKVDVTRKKDVEVMKTRDITKPWWGE